MAEKLQIQKIERSNLVPDTKESMWFADAIAEIQKESSLSNEEASLVLYDQTISQLRTLNEDKSSAFQILNENRDKKVEKAIELSLIISSVLSKESVEDLINKSNSNKFRPLSMTIEPGDIIKEKETYRESGNHENLTGLEAKELATCKKIVDILLVRIFSDANIASLSNIFELNDSSPELAADLGKLIQAAELIQLHRQRLESVSQQNNKRMELLDNAIDQTIGKTTRRPTLYLKELLEKSNWGPAVNNNFAGFNQKTRDLEQKTASKRRVVSARGQTIN
ncbi:MAG: hypothetical protein HY226_05760 [Candidatus Vogelbacteria bacterium]|nr:hypothetical protein [Candidatus Vogelbacteria bacterium]